MLIGAFRSSLRPKRGSKRTNQHKPRCYLYWVGSFACSVLSFTVINTKCLAVFLELWWSPANTLAPCCRACPAALTIYQILPRLYPMHQRLLEWPRLIIIIIIVSNTNSSVLWSLKIRAWRLEFLDLIKHVLWVFWTASITVPRVFPFYSMAKWCFSDLKCNWLKNAK